MFLAYKSCLKSSLYENFYILDCQIMFTTTWWYLLLSKIITIKDVRLKFFISFLQSVRNQLVKCKTWTSIFLWLFFWNIWYILSEIKSWQILVLLGIIFPNGSWINWLAWIDENNIWEEGWQVIIMAVKEIFVLILHSNYLQDNLT